MRDINVRGLPPLTGSHAGMTGCIIQSVANEVPNQKLELLLAFAIVWVRHSCKVVCLFEVEHAVPCTINIIFIRRNQQKHKSLACH